MADREGVVAYIWQYNVKQDRVDAFRHAYGPDGVWAVYFSQSVAYLGTDLFEDCDTPGHFVTVDYFSNGAARSELVAREAQAFDLIDSEWEQATLEEDYVGQFNMSAGVVVPLPRLSTMRRDGSD